MRSTTGPLSVKPRPTTSTVSVVLALRALPNCSRAETHALGGGVAQPTRQAVTSNAATVARSETILPSMSGRCVFRTMLMSSSSATAPAIQRPAACSGYRAAQPTIQAGTGAEVGAIEAQMRCSSHTREDAPWNRPHEQATGSLSLFGRNIIRGVTAAEANLAVTGHWQ